MLSDKAIVFGSVSITYYAICILVGAITAFLLIKREWNYKGYNKSDLNDFFFNVLLVGILGARLWYVVFNLAYYLENPLAIVQIWQGGLAIHGGLVAGGIYGYFYFKKRNYDFLDVADTIFPYVLIAQAIGRWGNFFNQEAYGPEVSYQTLQNMFIPQFVIDGMFINGAYHHPTFLYESIFALVSFAIIRIVIKKTPLKVGQSALLYAIFYSFGRLIVEQMRMDSLMLGAIKFAQLFSVVIIVVSLILFYRFDKKNERNKLQVMRDESGK